MEKIESGIEQLVFKSRWLLAPLFIGLIGGIVLLLVKFFQELAHLLQVVVGVTESEVVVGILSLVDMALVGSLLLMIIFSGYEIFVSKIDVGDHEDKPDWMGKVDFSGLKLKVISAIVAISAIELLKSLVGLSQGTKNISETTMMWQMAIHSTFVLSGLIFALTDYIAGKK